MRTQGVPIQALQGGAIALIERQVGGAVKKIMMNNSGGGDGVANVFVVPSAEQRSVALSVNENADPTVRTDHTAALKRLSDDAETRTLFLRKSVTLPVQNGRLDLGTWQGIYLVNTGAGEVKDIEVYVTFVPTTAASSYVLDAKPRASTPVQTAELAREVKAGLLFVHEKHTSASMCLQRDADAPGFEKSISVVIPEAWNHDLFEHTYEGPDDMPGHMKCSLVGCSVTVPVHDGTPLADVYLNEHRDGGGYGVGHSRKIVLRGTSGTGGSKRVSVTLTGPVTEVSGAVLPAARGLAAAGAAAPAVNVFCADASAVLALCSSAAAERFLKASACAGDPALYPAIGQGRSVDIPSAAFERVGPLLVVSPSWTAARDITLIVTAF